MIFLSREPTTWVRDKVAMSDYDLYQESTGSFLYALPLKLSLLECQMLFFMAFNALVKFLAPKTNHAKVANVIRELGSQDLDGWILMSYFRDGLEIFMGTDDDDRIPLTLEFLSIWHEPLDRDDFLDHLFITSDNKALKDFSRRSEYSVPDAISDHGDRKMTISQWKMYGFGKTLGAYPPEEIRDIVFNLKNDIDILQNKFMHKMKYSSTFLRVSKTDYMKKKIWTVAGTTADLDSDVNINVIRHLHRRLLLGEVLHADSPLLGIRIEDHTVPLDNKFLDFYDKMLSKVLRIDRIFNVKGQSRRKGAATTMAAAGIDIAEVRTAGRWSNGLMDRYVKKSPARLAELDVIACESALQNRAQGRLPPAIAI